MKQWLLEGEKAKVGRPKLANEDLVKKSMKMIITSFVICFVMLFCFYSYIKGSTPFEMLYSFSFEKLLGSIDNKDGFIVEEKYKNNDYVMSIKPSLELKKYKATFEYTTYYLKNNEWVKYDSKKIENNSTFNIKFESLQNVNRTWKVKISVITDKTIDKKYNPYAWKFVDSNEDNSYTYKVFTVKGYYSPIKKEESKSYKEDSKIIINTEKNNPRKFNIKIDESNYSLKVTYTDDNDKKTLLINDDYYSNNSFTIPNINKCSNVELKIYIKDINDEESLDKIKPATWEIKKDSKNNYYITNTYLLKPEQAY